MWSSLLDMKNKFFLIFFILVFCGAAGLAQTYKYVDLCQIDNHSFIPGEKLRFRIYYNWKFVWVPAGEVEFSIEELDEEHYWVEVIGKTYPAYESFFKVDDFYASRIDKSSLLPEYFLRDVEEGSYNRYDSIHFDQTNMKIESHWGKHREDAEQFEFESKTCVQDMVSILYFVRNLNYDELDNKTIVPVEIFFDKEFYPLKMEVNKREKKKVKGLGKFKTIKLIPEAVDGHVFDEDTKMDVWISDDQNKIPLLIESPLTIGSAKAVLIRHEGLRYPLDSKLK